MVDKGLVLLFLAEWFEAPVRTSVTLEFTIEVMDSNPSIRSTNEVGRARKFEESSAYRHY